MSDRTVTEYRVVNAEGRAFFVPGKYDESALARWDRVHTHAAPHRLQRRTVTTSEWEDVDGGV